MAIETGIISRGKTLPQTEWVSRDSRAWWRAGDRGVVSRRGASITQIVGHWTGGSLRTGDDTAYGVYRAMRARKRPDGSPMSVAVHFVIGADGRVWQLADVADATVHVGDRAVNARSIGIEVCWPGTYALPNAEGIVRRVHGREIRVHAPPEPAVRAWVRLCDALVAYLGIDTAVPVGRDGAPWTRVISARRRAEWRGALEHLHCGTRKADAAGILLEALLRAGWRGIMVGEHAGLS